MVATNAPKLPPLIADPTEKLTELPLTGLPFISTTFATIEVVPSGLIVEGAAVTDTVSGAPAIKLTF